VQDEASPDNGSLPLPDRREEGDAAEAGGVGDLDAAPPFGDDSTAPGSDANTDATGPGCNGVLDCERVVFVTKGQFVGSAVGGLAGGDAKCQAAADTSTSKRIKGRTFRAWLSTAALSASSRVPHGTKPFILASNAVVANNWTDLIDGDLVNGIDRDETNSLVNGGTAWTGTTSTGAGATNATCGAWDTTAASGTRGNVGGAGGGWSSATGTTSCSTQLHLYCFEL
jgi:hypothetical protein